MAKRYQVCVDIVRGKFGFWFKNVWKKVGED